MATEAEDRPVLLVWTTGSPWAHAEDPQGQEITRCRIRFFHGPERRQGDWDEVTCPRCRVMSLRDRLGEDPALIGETLVLDPSRRDKWVYSPKDVPRLFPTLNLPREART
jgi:hypothetical protein